jgi:hypothetical protein
MLRERSVVEEEEEEEWRPEPEVVRLLQRLPRVKVWFEETVSTPSS